MWPGASRWTAGERRAAAGDVLQGEVGVERRRVDLAAQPGDAGQRLQLGGEGEGAVGEHRPQQRLLADAVAGEHEPLARRIPQRQREHAVQPLDEAQAVLLVEVRQQRRVAVAADPVAAGVEVGAQLLEVVDLAVEDDRDGAGLVGRRLVALVEVDDAQPPMPERRPPGDVDAAVVRPAVQDRQGHPLDD